MLIDEWVAYARQLHDQGELAAGDFETQFTFAQVLTESAKAARDCLLLVSLPASDTATSPHAQSDDIEVGGQRGREALNRLRNVVERVATSWRPASMEEGFEIVRRRLFEPLIDPEQFKARDLVAREFYDCYRTQAQEFPPECRDAEYEKRLKAAYPIHPEVFDQSLTGECLHAPHARPKVSERAEASGRRRGPSHLPAAGDRRAATPSRCTRGESGAGNRASSGAMLTRTGLVHETRGDTAGQVGQQ